MTATASEIKTMIATCRGIYRAITELDQVAAPRGANELQRDAFRACGDLQKKLDAALADWNLESELPTDDIVECDGNGSGKYAEWSTSATRENCDTYTLRNDSGLCNDCLAASLKYGGVR